MAVSPLAQRLIEAAHAEVTAAGHYNAAADLFLARLGGRAPEAGDRDVVMAVIRLKDLAQGAVDRAKRCVEVAEHVQANDAAESVLPGVGDLS